MLQGAMFWFWCRELAARVWAVWIRCGVSRPAGSSRKRASCAARQRPLSDMHGRCCGSGASERGGERGRGGGTGRGGEGEGVRTSARERGTGVRTNAPERATGGED